jgi:hypothetical protein
VSAYDNIMASTDLDTYRSDGEIHTRSVTFSGSLAGGAEIVQTTSAYTLTDQDFNQVSFDNSFYSSGKFRDIALEYGTYVLETTTSTPLIVIFEPQITGDSMTIRCVLKNPYSGSVDLQSTTINFRFTAYDSTLL